MTDLETELREAMRATVAGARPPRNLMELLRRRRRRHRARQLAISAAAGAVIVAAVPTSLALLSSGGRPAGGAGSATISAPASAKQTAPARHPGQPRPPRGWARHRDGAGDYIDTPAGWHVTSRAALVEPVVRWVIGTGPVRSGGGCAPTVALRQMPADGALLQLIEYGGSGGQAYDFPPRDGRLGPDRLRSQRASLAPRSDDPLAQHPAHRAAASQPAAGRPVPGRPVDVLPAGRLGEPGAQPGARDQSRKPGHARHLRRHRPPVVRGLDNPAAWRTAGQPMPLRIRNEGLPGRKPAGLERPRPLAVAETSPVALHDPAHQSRPSSRPGAAAAREGRSHYPRPVTGLLGSSTEHQRANTPCPRRGGRLANG